MESQKDEKKIEKKTTHIDTLSLQDAIMVLDLSERPVLMFKNLDNNRINVIYKQNEDRIILLDSGMIS